MDRDPYASSDLSTLGQHSSVCSLLFLVKLSSRFPLRTRHFRIKTGILFINPRFYRLLGDFKLIGLIFFLYIWLWLTSHTVFKLVIHITLFISTKTRFMVQANVFTRNEIVELVKTGLS